MIETIAIAFWAHLFCGPWSESGKVFGWLKNWASRLNPCTGAPTTPEWVLLPLIGCSMCHAVWVAGIVQVWHVAHGWDFGAGNILQILLSSFLAGVLDDFALIRDKWKNN